MIKLCVLLQECQGPAKELKRMVHTKGRRIAEAGSGPVFTIPLEV